MQMATRLKKTSAVTATADAQYAKARIGIVVSEWNDSITLALLAGAVDFLVNAGLPKKHVLIKTVPGSYELPLGAQWFAKQKDIDGVIALGCVIQGETRHFDFICDAVAHGLMDVGLRNHKPVAFGVLTTQTLRQAQERAGGKLGNKGAEAAETVLKMLQYRK